MFYSLVLYWKLILLLGKCAEEFYSSRMPFFAHTLTLEGFYAIMEHGVLLYALCLKALMFYAIMEWRKGFYALLMGRASFTPFLLLYP